MQTRKQALHNAQQQLQQSSQTPLLDAEVLCCYTLQITKEKLYSNPEKQLTKQEEKRLHETLQQRINNTPIAHITGEKEFYGRIFKVTPDTLIPRPETEILIEHIINNNNQTQPLNILELGTGSGCIAITLAELFPNATITATDISKEALEVARENGKLDPSRAPSTRFARSGRTNVRLRMTKKRTPQEVSFIQSDLFKNIPQRQFDIIVANLPYLSEEEYNTSPTPEIHHEPKNALTAPEDGLELIQQTIEQAQQYLGLNGELYLEFLPRQWNKIEKIGKQNHYKSTPLHDYSGNIRFAKLTTTKQQNTDQENPQSKTTSLS